MFGTDAKKDIDDTSETRMGPKDLASYTQWQAEKAGE